MGAAASYPSVAGSTYDTLAKGDRITFNDDADSIEIVQRFKKKTGVDLFTLNGSDFASTVNALMIGRQIAGNFKAPPSKYSFYHNLRTKTRGITEPASNYAYDYFFKDPETPEEKAKSAELAQQTAQAGAAAKEAKANGEDPAKKDQTFMEWVMSFFDGTASASANDTSTDTSTDISKPDAVASKLSSFSSMTANATDFVSSGGSSMSSAITPANPVPDTSSFQTNASNIVKPTVPADGAAPATAAAPAPA